MNFSKSRTWKLKINHIHTGNLHILIDKKVLERIKVAGRGLGFDKYYGKNREKVCEGEMSDICEVQLKKHVRLNQKNNIIIFI